MGVNWERLPQIRKEVVMMKCGGTWTWWREPFQIVTTHLLSLLLPLSFLLLARLSTAAHYLASAEPYSSTTFLSFLFLHNSNTNSIILFLYGLVSLVSVAALVYAWTGGRMKFVRHESTEPAVPRPRLRLYAAWILLCTLQLCVGLGIEGSIEAGVEGSGVSSRVGSGSWLSRSTRLMVLVGLHETMQFWSKSVVRPVVEDTVMGFVKEEEEGRIERVAMGLSLGTLWLWGLRDEIDSLVVVVAAEDYYVYVGWWLYYLTVSIGIIRVFKGGIWLGMLLFFSRKPQTHLTHFQIEDQV